MVGDYKIVDLFSGSGGSALGFARQGFDIAVAVDVDKLASETFRTNFPKAAVLNQDIRLISGYTIRQTGKISDADKTVMIACPPCQGFSSARRKSQAMSDPRNNLIYEFVRLVEELNPIVFVMENVPGLAKGVGKEVFAITLKKLNRLGYKTVHNVVDCADYGVPQKRKRLVLIGSRHPNMRQFFPRKTNQNPEDPSTYLPAWRTVRDVIADLPKVKAGVRDSEDPMHISANLADINLKRMIHTPSDGGDRSAWPEELLLECHKKVNGFKDVYGRMRWDAPSPTITGGCVMISKGRFGHPEQNRAVTLREAARIQTFPDSFKFIGNFGEIARQIGNAVPPLLAERIAGSLVEALDELTVASRVLESKEAFAYAV